jgi:hypothetical protein
MAEVGYSTHGCWAPLERIKEIEVEERENEWFEDDGLDLSQYEAIWVCLAPEEAVGYALLAEELGTKVQEEAKKHPLDYVVEVNLMGAVPVLEDPDGGYLYIRKTRKK